ncbi:hypothetical protein HQ584_05080 [Patescibacteria group bacterium]|nr:hypothetical protein [Patescibacteria group bacterium]
MKTLKEYAEELKKYANSPNELDDLLAESTADYAFYTEELLNIKLGKAKFWVDLKTKHKIDGKIVDRENPLSDKLTEQLWFADEIGQRELRLKYKVKALEKIGSSCRAVLFNQEREMRM